jgi:DivIVA domain-containing protein
VVDGESSKADERAGPSPRAPRQGQGRGFRDLRDYVPADILDVSFPVSVRGYDRRAVDDHIKRVNRVIAELKVSASPPAAVRHALDQAGEKVEGLLKAAREAAEEITSSARQEAEEGSARAKAEAAEFVVNTSAEADRMRAEADEHVAKAAAEADDTVAKAKAEANEIVLEARTEAEKILTHSQAEADERHRHLQEELAALRDQAETRLREIQTETETIWKTRGELLDDIRTMASGLFELADGAATRVPPRDPAEPESEKKLQPEAGNETETPPVGADESTQALRATARHQAGSNARDEKAETTAPGRRRKN